MDLFKLRQKLYRLYDIENMNDNRINSLKRMYAIIKEYDLESLIANGINDNKELIDKLYDIKKEIDNAIKNADDFNSKRELMSRLDIILTLIAIVESDNKKALSKILITNELIEEGLLEGNIKDNISKKKEELERAIIEAKKEYYYI
ncbi:MAG: hypothetical protein KatS3mg003_2067 [Candidatus Nitrosocaldaceae archaeon]|nr:MAG: hypothetical protein KatS3mg003_2067 [Candidatus Nitrosocaldaceae archaeon]